MQLADACNDIWHWVIEDFNSWPFRFTLEVIVWGIALGASGTLALTVPNSPFMLLYPIWIITDGIFAWGVWTRNSFGLMTTCLTGMTLSIIATLRLFLG